MYQVCTCPQSNLTGGDPQCPIHGQPPAQKTYFYCEKCAALEARCKELEEQLEYEKTRNYNNVANADMEREELKSRIVGLEKVVDEMPGWIAAIKAERLRQDMKWGEQNHNDFKWLSILVEEVGELAKAILENDPKGVEELVHCATVCVQWMDAVKRRAALKEKP